MKKILVIASLLLPLMMSAQKVNKEDAETVARNFYFEKYLQIKKKNLANLNFKKEKTNIENEGQKSVYIFNVDEGNGFVIISGNKSAYPVLAYSFENTFNEDEMPPAVADWINGYKKQIESAGNLKHTGKNKTKTAWEKYTDADFLEKLSTNFKSLKDELLTDIPPLLSTTWNQGVYYNALCPTCSSGGSGGHVWAGCVATAQAQLMKYYNYPEHGIGQHSYTHSDYGLQSADFESTTYDWAGMPASLSAHNSAVATLIYHCGVSVNMDYDPSGSGAYSSSVVTSLENYFKYSTNLIITSKSSYTEENWKNLLRAELDAGRPMYYSGYGSGGHAFNCDGYQGTDYFHFNWGWGGSYNGYFYLDDLSPGSSDFSNSQSAIIGAVPETMEAYIDSTSAAVLTCGTPYYGTTADGENINNQYDGISYHLTGKEKAHKITTSLPGRISASITDLNGNNLDVLILKYANRNNMLAFGDSMAIADDTEPGTYYIIVDGRYGAEGGYTLTVNCPSIEADLIVEANKLEPMYVTPGGKLKIMATVKNIGNSSAPANILKYYISEDQQLTGDDVVLGSTTVSSLSSQQKIVLDKLFTLPTSISSGTKYLILQVDANDDVAESDEVLNLAIETFQVPPAGIMDCSSSVILHDGVTYTGNTSLQGQANITNYNYVMDMTNKEIIHKFTPQYSGIAKVNFKTQVEGEMLLIMTAGCNENACLNVFGYSHAISDTIHEIYVAAGIDYYLIADGNNQHGDAEGGYSLKVDFPEECPAPEITCPYPDKCIGDSKTYLYTNYEYSGFQWLKNGTPLTNETNSMLYTDENGIYTVKVTENGCTGESEGVQITYSSKPSTSSISALSATEFCEGSSVILELSTGMGYTYQWTKNNSEIPSATLLNYEVTETGKYKAKVTNLSCTIETNAIDVQVNHSAYDNGQPVPISTDSLVTGWLFDNWGSDISPASNYASIMGAYQCDDRNLNYSAFSFDGTDDYITSNKSFNDPDTFTVAIWFKTNSNGPLIGFDDKRYDENSTTYNRCIYLGNNGLVQFGVENASKHTIASIKSYNDDKWHLAVASLSPLGMKLYLDGELVNQLASVTDARAYTGYWKVAAATLTEWPNAGNEYFNGSIDDVRIYKRGLNDAEVETLYEQQFIKITAENNVICESSGSTNIMIENSERGVTYQLMNESTSFPIGSEVEGNSGTILLPTSTLSTTTGIFIKAENDETGCINELDSVYLINVGIEVEPEVQITSNASFNEFCKNDTITFNQTSLYAGTSPTYKWKINGIETDNHNSKLIITKLENEDIISLELISSLTCANPNTANSNEIKVTINPLPEINLGDDVSINTDESITLDAGEGFEQYLWNTDETTSQIIVDGSLGIGNYTYTVQVTDTKDCSYSDTIVVHIKTALGLDIQDNPMVFKVYPNPVRDFVIFEFSQTKSPTFLTLINNRGQKVFQKKYSSDNQPIIKDELNLCEFERGIYYLSIQNKDFGRKIVKLIFE